MIKLNILNVGMDDIDNLFEELECQNRDFEEEEYPGKKGLEDCKNLQGNLVTVKDLQEFFSKVKGMYDEHTKYLVQVRKAYILNRFKLFYLALTTETWRTSLKERNGFKAFFRQFGISSVLDIETKFENLNHNDFKIKCYLSHFDDNIYYFCYLISHKYLSDFEFQQLDSAGMYFTSDYLLDCDIEFNIIEVINNPEILLENDITFQRNKKIDQLLG